jgi:hypothetical protein
MAKAFYMRFIVVGLFFAGLAAWAQPRAQSNDVDLALVLAIDCSFSVEASEYRLQMRGLGQALQSPEVIDAIRSGPRQKIAVLVLLWSDIDNQRVVLPWTVIADETTARSVGSRLSNQMRLLAEGGTATAAALRFSAQQFSNAPMATRKVIDLSTDGRNNMGATVGQARDQIVAEGITINGLAISNEWATLDAYVLNHIAGGQGHFVYEALTYADFGAVMLKKLVREIIGPGTT